eukprot:TRINITY_DN12537_c0_g1_i1.p1 TRINITY_DN12537_c0_g1~~TRINITY_DN12537_c0_g1_i1.p1  ORF type:complete len:201 (+),score=39.92 TRINITY_DN12537_c0_g1_i1:34-636(+)
MKPLFKKLLSTPSNINKISETLHDIWRGIINMDLLYKDTLNLNWLISILSSLEHNQNLLPFKFHLNVIISMEQAEGKIFELVIPSDSPLHQVIQQDDQLLRCKLSETPKWQVSNTKSRGWIDFEPEMNVLVEQHWKGSSAFLNIPSGIFTGRILDFIQQALANPKTGAMSVVQRLPPMAHHQRVTAAASFLSSLKIEKVL